MKYFAQLLVTTIVSLFGVCTHGEEWGSLAGRIVYDGAPPARSPIEVKQDVECCGMQSDESLLVDGKTRGIRNVAIWLAVAPGDPAPPIHAERIASAKEKVTLQIKDCRYHSHVVATSIGQPLSIHNGDQIGHNAWILSRDRLNYANTIIKGDDNFEHVFRSAETIPVRIVCSIHSWMSSFVIVKDHPYVAISGEDGSFEINDLPAGKWTFQFWHERAGYIEQVERNGDQARWNKGFVEVVIPPDETLDLGEIKVAPEEFERNRR